MGAASCQRSHPCQLLGQQHGVDDVGGAGTAVGGRQGGEGIKCDDGGRGARLRHRKGARNQLARWGGHRHLHVVGVGKGVGAVGQGVHLEGEQGAGKYVWVPRLSTPAPLWVPRCKKTRLDAGATGMGFCCSRDCSCGYPADNSPIPGRQCEWQAWQPGRISAGSKPGIRHQVPSQPKPTGCPPYGLPPSMGCPPRPPRRAQ